MISFDEAQALLRQYPPLFKTGELTLSEALGSTLSVDVCSAETVPSFDNSAMDGFALRFSDAQVQNVFTVAGRTLAGENNTHDIDMKGRAWRIMTGAPLPVGLDSVVPVEQVQLDGECIRLLQPVLQGQHVRRRGEDMTVGQTVLSSGTRLQTQHLMIAAAAGVARLPCRMPLRAIVFATGNELVDDVNVPLQGAQIRNSNGPFLMSALQQAGVLSEYGGTVRDDLTHFKQQLQNALKSQPDLIVTSGAVSMGDVDFIPAVLRELGAEILFHKVAIKPGKPLLFARIGRTTIFGLPGNPVSTLIGFRFFLFPWLQQGKLALFSAQLTRPLKKKSALREFRKAQVHLHSGQWLVTETAGQESHKVAALAYANAWIVLPETGDEWPAGCCVVIAGLTENYVAF